MMDSGTKALLILRLTAFGIPPLQPNRKNVSRVIRQFSLNHQFLNHHALTVRVLLLEHSFEVVSTSSIYFVKLVRDVRRPFQTVHFGGD